MSSGTGSLGCALFLLAIHCKKLFSAQAVVLAVLAGVTPSANLDSSSSLAKANRRLVVAVGCGSLAQEGGRSSSGCGHDAGVAMSAFQGSLSKNTYRGSKDQTDR